MPEYIQHIIGIALLALVYIITRKGIAMKLQRSTEQVINELRSHHSTDVYSAIHLDYAQVSWLKFGLRDYKRKALESLVTAGVVGKTTADKYYLIEDPVPGKGVEAD
jgi:hypothetical protein